MLVEERRNVHQLLYLYKYENKLTRSKEGFYSQRWKYALFAWKFGKTARD